MPAISTTVRLRRITGAMEEVTPLHREGLLAIHRGLEEESNLWVVSHIPTGRSFAKLLSEEDALKIMEDAWRLLWAAFQRKTKEEVKEALPQWVYSWIIAVDKDGLYLAPEPFIEIEQKQEQATEASEPQNPSAPPPSAGALIGRVFGK